MKRLLALPILIALTGCAGFDRVLAIAEPVLLVSVPLAECIAGAAAAPENATARGEDIARACYRLYQPDLFDAVVKMAEQALEVKRTN